jgi:hypothetical protein
MGAGAGAALSATTAAAADAATGALTAAAGSACTGTMACGAAAGAAAAGGGVATACSDSGAGWTVGVTNAARAGEGKPPPECITPCPPPKTVPSAAVSAVGMLAVATDASMATVAAGAVVAVARL